MITDQYADLPGHIIENAGIALRKGIDFVRVNAEQPDKLSVVKQGRRDLGLDKGDRTLLLGFLVVAGISGSHDIAQAVHDNRAGGLSAGSDIDKGILKPQPKVADPFAETDGSPWNQQAFRVEHEDVAAFRFWNQLDTGFQNMLKCLGRISGVHNLFGNCGGRISKEQQKFFFFCRYRVSEERIQQRRRKYQYKQNQ